jgi:DNA repair photolyase
MCVAILEMQSMKTDISFVIERGRVLVPIGEPCPFACKYCYTRSGEVGPPRINVEEILKQFHAFATQKTFETIQLGYDGDPFAHPHRGMELLQGLVREGKNINFSTKALLQGSLISEIALIQHDMAKHGNVLSALISLSCWDSASKLEPHTPPPQDRMVTIRNLKSIEVPTFISVRPILPNVQDIEYERIVEKGIQAGCDGFILGPLYSDAKGRFTKFIAPDILHKVPSEKRTVSWSPHSPEWTRYEDVRRTRRLAAFIQDCDGKVFTSSADAVHDFSRVVVGEPATIEVGRA